MKVSNDSPSYDCSGLIELNTFIRENEHTRRIKELFKTHRDIMRVTNDLLFLKRQEISFYFLTHLEQAVQAIKQAYLNHNNQKTMNPPSSFLHYDKKNNARIIALPAYMKQNERHAVGIKWISSCPKNIQNKLPRASSLILLNDYNTGFPMAVLEGALISALRTVISALIALEFLHENRVIENLGIIGCGTISGHFMRCLDALGWKINKLNLYDISQERAMTFAEQQKCQVKLCSSLEEVTSESNVLLLTTTAKEPYLFDPKIFQKNATLLNLSLRDISPEVMLNAFNLVDDVEHVLQAETSPHLTFLACGHKDFIHGTISDAIAKKVMLEKNKLKIFSPMGMGILDIALANLVFQYYYQREDVTCINDFF
ncbi:MAG: 2,3-diaminopropionate biosynthesis protein SbnB [Legionellaceae bacterium]|nr:2,3-diaminopropionate biosynthesis protein SbnB [Legionellaceae bacterium]